MDSILCFLGKWQPLFICLASVGTFAVALAAVFGSWLKDRFMAPQLLIKPGIYHLDYEKAPLLREGQPIAEAFYLQIPIWNKGRSVAEKIEVFIEKIEKKINGKPDEMKGFYPLNLVWRHFNIVYLERLSPQSYRDITLGRIADPQTRRNVGDDSPALKMPGDHSPFKLWLAVQPTTRCDLLSPGKYHLSLEITAANARKPNVQKIELEFNGEWLPNNPMNMATVKLIR